ncbi:hypothetical protein P606_11870 [Comamonas thiooxydans]|nr:hypothetical protein P606_11870 [Comamonas thiooxydans]
MTVACNARVELGLQTAWLAANLFRVVVDQELFVWLIQ